MVLKNYFSEVSPEFIVFLLTALLAFLSWIIKGLIENPLIESKATFNNLLGKRIDILTEVKTRLNLIAYFPSGKESIEYKEQLQQILLRDGKPGYLDKTTFENVLKISIDSSTDENLLLATIKEIDRVLYSLVSKVQDEVQFYINYSNFNPLKRFLGYVFLSLQYIFSLLVILVVLIWFIYGLFNFDLIWKIILLFTFVLGGYLSFKWMKREY